MAKEFGDIGREIRDAVLDAVNSGDFSQLNGRITRSVGDAIDEVNARLGCRGSAGADAPQGRGPAQEPETVRAEEPRKHTITYKWPDGSSWHIEKDRRAAEDEALCTVRPGSRAAGILLTVFGAIFLGSFGLAALITLAVGLAKGVLGAGALAVCIVFGTLALGSGAMLGAGCSLSGRAKRLRAYAAALRGKTYCAISDLARRVRKPEAFVCKELHRLIARGNFPQGHIDDEQKTLLLTDEVYDQYRALQRQRAEAAAAPAETPEARLYRETAEQGERYLTAIRRANDAIPGEAVSEKLYRLEDVVRRIFGQVKEHPEQLPELRRFLDYYMPTTLKLVETYEELDGQPSEGENIRKAKAEIEKTLDTINQAFENLFDSLFAHTAVDISSDISVLKTLLKQEGLTGSDFT